MLRRLFPGNVYASGSVTQNSDARLKKNVKPMVGAMDQLLQLKGVTFQWIDPAKHGDQTGIQRGFIAQDVEKVFPDWVGVDRDGFKTLSVQQVEALEVESIRTLKAQNEALEARLKVPESAYRPLLSGLTAESTVFGFGLVAMAGAFVVSVASVRSPAARRRAGEAGRGQ